MKLRALAALFLGALLLRPALSASIECMHASSEAEKRICASASLARLDRQMNEAYSRLLSKLPAHYHDRVREAQRDWIALRDDSVLQRTQQHEKSGLDELMRARISLLDGALLEINSLRFLNLGDYRPTYLLTTLPGTAAYNRWADGEWRKVTASNEAAARAQRPGQTCKGDCEPQTTTSRVFRLGFASPEMLTVQVTTISYTDGAAHPDNDDICVRWWLARSGEITPRDMFLGTAGRKVMTKHVERFLRDSGLNEKGQLDPQALDWALKSALNPDHWGLSDDGLRVVGQGYDYSMGRGYVEFTIPWAAFGDALNPTFKTALERDRGAVPRVNN